MNKLPLAFGLLLMSIFFFQCEKKKEVATPEVNRVDTSQYKQVDSVTVTTRHALKDTILTIKADSVNALYYPNTGKFVMKLKAGDVCKITKAGRYDVVDGKGNFWVRVERFGGKGWIWGGQTSLESDIWVFSEGMTELGHPYIKYKLNKLSATNFDELFKLAGKAIEKTEYAESDDEGGGTREVDYDDDEILITEDDKLGTITKESFKPGPANDSIQSVNYFYTSMGTDTVSFNHTLITFRDGAKVAFVADFFGELKEMHRVGKNYLLAADYSLTGSNLGKVQHTKLAVWSPSEKKIISRQRLGYSAVDIKGYPIFKRWEDGSYISEAKTTFAKVDGKLTMEIFETYSRLNDARQVEEKVVFITRYFTFNESTNLFEESRQEVIYQAK